MRILVVLFLATAAFAQAGHRTENRALLGIVTAPVSEKDKRTKVVVLHVLKKSPAAKAGLKAGDEIVSIAEKSVSTPPDVDAALKEYAGGESVVIAYRRDKREATGTAKLIKRTDYKGDFLKRPRRGETKFKAPDWFVYQWAQAAKEPPTRATTKKKVVVIHCFQSW